MKRKSILGGIKSFQIEHSDLGKRRVLNAFDQSWQIESATMLPFVRYKRREQDVLTALQGIGIKLEQAKKAARHRLRPLSTRFGIVGGRRLEGSEHVDRNATATARRVDDHVHLLSQRPDALRPLPPSCQALPPCFRLLLGIGSDVQSFSLRFFGIYPWLKILPPQIRKGEKQISEVSLRIDDDGRDSIEGGFFKKGQTKTGLPTAGHTDADGMSDEITRVVEHRERRWKSASRES